MNLLVILVYWEYAEWIFMYSKLRMRRMQKSGIIKIENIWRLSEAQMGLFSQTSFNQKSQPGVPL
jgi:hypothetical protein